MIDKMKTINPMIILVNQLSIKINVPIEEEEKIKKINNNCT